MYNNIVQLEGNTELGRGESRTDMATVDDDTETPTPNETGNNNNNNNLINF